MQMIGSIVVAGVFVVAVFALADAPPDGHVPRCHNTVVGFVCG